MLLRFVLGIAAACTLLVALVPQASAQEPLARTQIGGMLPEQGGLALVVWGGGSLPQLQARATTRGCALSAAWVIRDGTYYGYIVGAPEIVNRAFLSLYPDDEIPAQTILIVKCEKPYVRPPFTQGSDQGCRTDWPEYVQRDVLSRMAVPVFTCYLIFKDLEGAQAVLGPVEPPILDLYNEWGFTAYHDPSNGWIVVINPVSVPRRTIEATLTHELCHANQHWQVIYSGERFFTDEAWLNTPAAQAFVEVGGWRQLPNGSWEADFNPITYTDDPIEAAAETCMIYLNPSSVYTPEQRDQYVPAAMRQWVEEYVALP